MGHTLLNQDSPTPILFCCGAERNQPSERLKEIIQKLDNAGVTRRIPWVERYKIKQRHQLLMNNEPLTKFLSWLKQWGRDIRDDGGTSRKSIGRKRKRRDSDSDFIDDDMEKDEELQKKSVILAGPTGCGKTAMVYLLAERCGFTVYEVNFSSPRSGKEIIRKVEESTLSRRLSSSGKVDKKHCLLLFKDIDQFYAKQDEGFHAAVAQLITASCRPIVMTVTVNHADCAIDSKIEKKEPLWISIPYPSPSLIASKVLLPIIEHQIGKMDNEFGWDDHPEDREFTLQILDSIARHCDCDIKKSINLTQFLWSSATFSLQTVHKSISNTFNVDFVTPITKAIPNRRSIKKKLKSTQKEMDTIAENLGFLTDLDQLAFSNLQESADPDTNNQPVDLKSYFEYNLNSILENQRAKDDPYNMTNLLRSLAFDTDDDIIKFDKDDRLYNKLVDMYVECGRCDQTYDVVGYIRTIVKTTVLNSVHGTSTRRSRRVLQYFYEMGKILSDEICETFDFQEYLEIGTKKDE